MPRSARKDSATSPSGARRNVAEASSALAAAGLGDMVWGHASVRDDDGRGVWMKAAGYGFEEVDDSRVLLVSWEGDVLEGNGRRHLEYPIHTQIYRARPDVGAVVHTHPPAVVAFASLDSPLHPLSHDGVPFAHDRLPRLTATSGALIATTELGDAVADALGDARGILLPGHGAVTVGPTIAAAVMYAVLLDRACRTELDALAAGGPKVWTTAEETQHKLDHVWSPDQLDAGYRYLVRRHHSHPHNTNQEARE